MFGAMLEAYRKLQSIPKTVIEFEHALQWIWTAFRRTLIAKGVKNFTSSSSPVPVNGGHFEHKM